MITKTMQVEDDDIEEFSSSSQVTSHQVHVLLYCFANFRVQIYVT